MPLSTDRRKREKNNPRKNISLGSLEADFYRRKKTLYCME